MPLVPIGKNVGAHQENPEKKPRNPDRLYMITYQNIEKVTFRCRKENGFKSNGSVLGGFVENEFKSTELEDTLPLG